MEAGHWREIRGWVKYFPNLCPNFSSPEFSYLALNLFEVEELIETEQRRRRRENLEEEDGQLGGSRNNLEEEARELTRLKEQVESKVSK